jgi:hypothetical protein
MAFGKGQRRRAAALWRASAERAEASVGGFLDFLAANGVPVPTEHPGSFDRFETIATDGWTGEVSVDGDEAVWTVVGPDRPELEYSEKTARVLMDGQPVAELLFAIGWAVSSATYKKKEATLCVKLSRS